MSVYGIISFHPVVHLFLLNQTSHPCHKWNIIHEEEPTYEQMKHIYGHIMDLKNWLPSAPSAGQALLTEGAQEGFSRVGIPLIFIM